MKRNEDRTTFMDVQETHANDVPAAIYSETRLNLYKEKKHPIPKIVPSPSRFATDAEVERVALSPSPSSYEILDSFNFMTTPRGNQKVGHEKKTCFVDHQAKLNYSPGPVKNHYTMKALKYLSSGPSSRKRL